MILYINVSVGDDAGSDRFASSFVLGVFPNGKSTTQVGRVGVIVQSNASSEMDCTLERPAQNLVTTFTFNPLPAVKKKEFDGDTYTSRTTGLNDGTTSISFDYDTRVNAYSLSNDVSLVLDTLKARAPYTTFSRTTDRL